MQRRDRISDVPWMGMGFARTPLLDKAHPQAEGEVVIDSSGLFKRALLTLACTSVLMFMSQTSAWADCHGNGDNAGSGSKALGGSGSYQEWSWNLSTRVVYVHSVSSAGMSTDICLDAYVDWMTASGDGHYDRRQGRVCQPGSFAVGQFLEPVGWGGREVTGLQKAAACRYEQVPPPAHLNKCNVLPEDAGSYDTESAIDPNTGEYCRFATPLPWTSKCAGTYVRHEDGTVDVGDGGDVQNCNS